MVAVGLWGAVLGPPAIWLLPIAFPITFSAGFVMATGLLHVCGIGLGLATRWPAGRVAVRIAGAAIVGAGVIFLHAALSL